VTKGFLFDRAVIDAGLLRLDEVLVERSLPRQRLVVVGGSYLALADLRHATRDIDTITRITEAIRLAGAVLIGAMIWRWRTLRRAC